MGSSTKKESEERQGSTFNQLLKDLNQDNLSYINSLLKTRSTSQQQTVLSEKQPVSVSKPEEKDAQHSRAKSFKEKPLQGEDKVSACHPHASQPQFQKASEQQNAHASSHTTSLQQLAKKSAEEKKMLM